MDSMGGLIYAYDLPIIGSNKLKWVDGLELQNILQFGGDHRVTVMIERVHSMPAQGVASSFQFGVGFGSILSIIQSLALPLEFVQPAKWKRDLGLSADKKAALHKARLMYPTADLRLEKHDGRAEAILIAHWARTRHLYRGTK